MATSGEYRLSLVEVQKLAYCLATGRRTARAPVRDWNARKRSHTKEGHLDDALARLRDHE
jgi:hypothetical protein